MRDRLADALEICALAWAALATVPAQLALLLAERLRRRGGGGA